MLALTYPGLLVVMCFLFICNDRHFGVTRRCFSR